jgi:hypothetical protein
MVQDLLQIAALLDEDPSPSFLNNSRGQVNFKRIARHFLLRFARRERREFDHVRDISACLEIMIIGKYGTNDLTTGVSIAIVHAPANPNSQKPLG